MPNLSRRWLAAGLCTLILAACGERKSITGPDGGPSASAASLPPTYGCASLEVSVHAKKVESVSIVGNRCGENLRLALGGAPEYDKARKVVRIPLVLENGGTTSLRDPARVYAWEDSLTVLVSPARDGEDDDEPDDPDDPADGRAAARRAANRLKIVGADSAIGLTAQPFAGAVLWRYDASLAPSAPQVLPAGARSQVRWIEVRKKRGVHKFSMTLWASATVASVPAEAIIVLVDRSVVGTLVHDTVAMVGDRVAYQFTAAPGYTDVAVRLDGLGAPTSGDVVAGAEQHVILAAAKRLVTVPVGAEALYASAQAVVTSSNTAAAFQDYLDAQYAYMRATQDAAQAERDISDINHLVFNFIDNREAVLRIDAALDGHSFRIGPATTLRDPGGDPISDPVIDPGAWYRQAPALTQGAAPVQPRMMEAPDDSIETSVFLYVNGINTLETQAGVTMYKLDELRFEIPQFNTDKIVVKKFYSRTYAALPTREQLEQECTAEWGELVVKGTETLASYADYMSRCVGDQQYQRKWDSDLMESARQVFAILYNTNGLEKDAEFLANDIQRYRDVGWHALVIAHSQGNLMANQAIHRLVLNRKFNAALDTNCIAVLSLASPTSVRWDVLNDKHFVFPVRVEGDLIPETGGSTYPAMSTVLSRQVAAEIASYQGNALAQLYLKIKYGKGMLHSVDNSYLKYEARDRVRQGMTSIYSACAVADIVPLESPMTVLQGAYFQPQIQFLNAFKDTIAPRMLASDLWESSDSSIASPVRLGQYRALALGTTQVEATRFKHQAVWDVTVKEAPPPSIVGSWSGKWRADFSPDSGDITMVISGVPGNPTAYVTWTWDGLTYTGGNAPGGTMSDNGISSGAAFWIGYKKPTGPDTGIYFYRYFAASTRSGSDTADGMATNGTGIDSWTITMTRVQP